MSSTPNLELELVPANSFQPWVAVNDALQLLDALVQLAVQDRTTATPPSTTDADVGKRWIVAASPTDAWSGHEGYIALCTAADQWRLIEPREGFYGWDIGATEYVMFNGAAWVTA